MHPVSFTLARTDVLVGCMRTDVRVRHKRWPLLWSGSHNMRPQTTLRGVWVHPFLSVLWHIDECVRRDEVGDENGCILLGNSAQKVHSNKKPEVSGE